MVASSAYNADFLNWLDGGSFHDEGDHPIACDEATGRTVRERRYVADWLPVVPPRCSSARVARRQGDDSDQREH